MLEHRNVVDIVVSTRTIQIGDFIGQNNLKVLLKPFRLPVNHNHCARYYCDFELADPLDSARQSNGITHSMIFRTTCHFPLLHLISIVHRTTSQVNPFDRLLQRAHTEMSAVCCLLPEHFYCRGKL